MASNPKLRPQKRKRLHVDRDDVPSLSLKRFKSTREHYSSSEHPPPAFWDGLSKVWLERRALKELDRRNAQSTRSCIQSKSARPLVPMSDYLSKAPQVDITLIKAFARQGGPDITDMRGYKEPRDGTSSSKSNSGRRKSTDPSSTTATCRKTILYGRGFEQNLIDHSVYLNNRTLMPPNWKETKSRLVVPRPSLSLLNFPDTEFEAFWAADAQAKDEDDVMINVVPFITGKNQKDFSARKTIFGNLEPLTDGIIVPANPDLYYGARPEQLNRQTRQELSSYIIPSTTDSKPMAPNFFLEAKGPDDAPSAAKRRTCYDGAVGARAMHKLQSFAAGRPVYDNKAYTITSTYQNGTLMMYTTHLTPSAGPGKSPEYHMSPLNGWAISGNPDTCRQGLTAFRNGNDLAREWRDGFISAANERAERPTHESSTYSGFSDTTDAYPVDESQTSADECPTISLACPVGPYASQVF